MICHEVEPLLSALVDDELEPDRVRILRAHLEECVTCRNFLDTEEEVKRLLHASKPAPVPSPPELANLADRVRLAAHAIRRRQRIRWCGLASAAAIAGALLLPPLFSTPRTPTAL